MTTVEQEPVIWRYDAELEQHFEESEWCHLYRPMSFDAVCGFRGTQHASYPWNPTEDVCFGCGKRTCVDCLRILEGVREGERWVRSSLSA